MTLEYRSNSFPLQPVGPVSQIPPHSHDRSRSPDYRLPRSRPAKGGQRPQNMRPERR